MYDSALERYHASDLGALSVSVAKNVDVQTEKLKKDVAIFVVYFRFFGSLDDTREPF